MKNENITTFKEANELIKKLENTAYGGCFYIYEMDKFRFFSHLFGELTIRKQEAKKCK